MPYDPQKHHRRSIRLRDYDYSQAGAYFVTLCTRNRECLFGDVVDGEMRLNEFGAAVEESWKWLAEQYEYVALDEWVIMPNHVHGIIWIVDDPGRGSSRTAPTMKRKPLGRLIGAFKTVSTKRINEMNGTPGAPVWQRNYYEHVIRSEAELNRIRRYIAANPWQWQWDGNNPVHIGRRQRH
ncbi:MAG: transposase [Chloroflexi bacterium]|nr:transposase [Chloroflexota bacterium]